MDSDELSARIDLAFNPLDHDQVVDILPPPVLRAYQLRQLEIL